MKTTRHFDMVLVLVLVFLSLFNSGCAALSYAPNTPGIVPPVGQVYTMSYAGTIQAIKAALQGTMYSETFMSADGTKVIFTWALGRNGVAMYLLDMTKMTGAASIDQFVAYTGNNASLFNGKDYNEIKDCLLQNGWKMVLAKELALITKTAIISGVQSAASTASSTFPTFVYFWAGPAMTDGDIMNTINPTIQQ